MTSIRLGPERCSELSESASREWLVADGCGGYAMGTVAGLRTRRYHGLLIVSVGPIGARRLGLAALDAVVEVGSARLRLSSHEWRGGVVDPSGHELLSSFAVLDGVPRWRWSAGGVVIERELAMATGRPAVGVVHRLVAAPGPARIRLTALCSWRDAHGERFGGGAPGQEERADGFVFEGHYRVRGPGFAPSGEWYRGVRYREEAARGLPEIEDLWCAGSFSAPLAPGEAVGVEAWAGDLDDPPPPAEQLVTASRARARSLVERAGARDETEALLVIGADRHVVEGPSVVAGYPWFGEWSRDTLTSYEGLFLETGRAEEGRRLIEREVGLLSEGMLANTSDVTDVEHNSADAGLWLVEAIALHVGRTGDEDLADATVPALEAMVDALVEGTRHGLAVDRADALLAEGAEGEEGLALTWMDARVEGRPITRRAGKAVEINALWINALNAICWLGGRVGRDESRLGSLSATATASFLRRFPSERGLRDVVDGDPSETDQLRPNQLLAVSLSHAPLRGRPEARAVVEAMRPGLLTPLGLRSLAPDDPAYRALHRGGPAERDGAYHEGTVWPWLIGPYVSACRAAGMPTAGVLDGLEGHLGEWGLGSVSETADGAAPHRATGCPFQAWSVAGLLTAWRATSR